jgi:hypothetical protein
MTTTSPTPTGAALERIKEILRSHYPRGLNPMLNEVHDLLDAALRAPSPAALERLTETLDPSAHALKARNQVWAQAVAIAHWGNSPTVAAALEAASKLPPSPPFGPRVLDQLYGGAPSPAALGEGEVELDALGNDICRDVCELPDRTSPEDQPLMLQVMTEELHGIVTERVRPLLTALTDMRAALKPFAAVADIYDDREDAHHQIWLDATEREVKALTVGACQKARTALSHYRSGKEKAE